MDSAVLEQILDETFDHAVVHHGYTNYMRDYEITIYTTVERRKQRAVCRWISVDIFR
jgi:hypothetical protein